VTKVLEKKPPQFTLNDIHLALDCDPSVEAMPNKSKISARADPGTSTGPAANEICCFSCR
jgi:hypothetical protein